MKKEKIQKAELNELTDGMMIGNTIKTDSEEYKRAQAIMYSRAQDQSIKETFEIELFALERKMKRYLRSNIRQNELKNVHDFYKEIMKITHISQVKLAEYINMKSSNLSNMLKNSKINYKLAKVLGKLFKIEPTLWLDIQYKNELLKNPSENKEKQIEDYSFDELWSISNE